MSKDILNYLESVKFDSTQLTIIRGLAMAQANRLRVVQFKLTVRAKDNLSKDIAVMQGIADGALLQELAK